VDNVALGASAALAAAFLWGLNAVIIKVGVGEGKVNTVSFNSVRIASSIPVITLLMLLIGEEVTLPQYPHVWLGVLVVSFIGPGVGDVAYIKSIANIGSGRAITIGYTYILVAQALAIIFLKEELTFTLLIGSLLAITGIGFIASESGSSTKLEVLGVSEALIASLAWGVGTVVNKYVLNYMGALNLALLRSLILTPAITLVGLKGLKTLTKKSLIIAIISGAFSYGLGIPLFLYAMKLAGVSLTVLINAATPVISRVLGKLLINEEVSWKGIVGTALTITGISTGLIHY